MAKAHINGIRSMTGILFFSLSVLATPVAVAQHSHGILTPGVTFPKDDSVLTDPPRMITMSFRVDVRLLKLALYSAEGEWINIGFTYDPGRMNNNFVLPIPGDLPPSAYYIAQWSVTDDRRGLVNGEFRFAFGPGAIPPSETIELESEGKVEILPETGSYRQESVVTDSG
jgi:methionine-rich copper-binding protein CopC